MTQSGAAFVAVLLAFPVDRERADSAAPPPGRGYLQGAVLPGGWPSGASGTVRDLHALRFSSALELDAALRIGEEAVLVHHPARYEAYYSLGTGIRSLAVLPVATGLDGIVVIDPRGLVLKEWNPRADESGFQLERVLAAGWRNVDALWVFSEGAKQRIYGHDPAGTGGPALLALEYDPALDDGQDDPWTALPTVGLPEVLVDLVHGEYDDLHAGAERLWLFASWLLVTDHAGTRILLAIPASASDRIGRLATGSFAYSPPAGPVLYSEPDLFLWATQVDSQSTLLSANGTALGGPAPYTLPARASDLAALDLDGDGWDEVVLAEESQGVSTLLWRDPGSPWNPFNAPSAQPPLGGADTLDTLELANGLASRPGIDALAAGDFDLDGDADLLVAHAGVAELRFWLGTFPVGGNESTRLRSNEQELEVTPQPGGEHTVQLTMERNPGAWFSHWNVEVWLDPSFAEDADEPVLLASQILADEDMSVKFSFDYDPSATGVAPDHVCWIVFTGLDYDEEDDLVLRRHATRVIYYAPDEQVEAALASAYYPEAEHLAGWEDGGESTGLRAGTRVGSGGMPSPPPQ